MELPQELSAEQQAAAAERIKVMEESEGYKLRSPGYETRLEKTLWEYRCATMIFLSTIGQAHVLESRDAASASNDHIFFPEDHKTLYAYARHYITWAVQQTKAKRREDSRPKLSTIANRRFMLMHHISDILDEKAPSYPIFFKKTNKALHYAAKTYGVNQQITPKAYLGRHDLRFLIDFDLGRDHVDFEQAERHHLAWILGQVCGVRVSSLGRSKGRPNNYLRWRDITISRMPDDGERFMVEIVFPYLKGYQDEHGLSGRGQLRMKIMPPQDPDNISISISYRMLAILLRNRFLKDHKDAESLLTGQELCVVIADDHLDKAVFLAGHQGNKGGVDRKNPTTVDVLTDYLRRRAEEAGFPKTVGMHAWRRKAANEMSRVLGRDVTRGFLHHRPGGTTLEEHYLDQTFDLDVARIAFGEDHQSGADEMREMSHEVLYRAELLMTPLQQKESIEAYVQRYANRDAPDWLREERRVRADAKRELRKYAQAMFKETFTKEQLLERRNLLKSRSKLSQKLYDRVQARLQQHSAKHESQQPASAADSLFVDDDDDENNDDDEDDRFDAGDAAGVVFGDEETDQGNEGAQGGGQAEPTDGEQDSDPNTTTLEISNDGPDATENTDSQSYSLYAREFFKLMLLPPMPAGQARRCLDCLADDTIPESQKSKLWKSASQLEKHLNSAVHTKYSRWVLQVLIRQQQDKEGLFECEALECGSRLRNQQDLIQHVKRQLDKEDPDASHAELGRRIGWKDEDFREFKKSAAARARARRARAKHETWFMGRPEQITALPTERPIVPPAKAAAAPIAVVGPPAGGWMERNRQMFRAAGVNPGSQPAFHELYKNWPVDVSRTVVFGGQGDGGNQSLKALARDNRFVAFGKSETGKGGHEFQRY